MFKKATRAKSKLRLALDGPSGSGKTMTALILAVNMGNKVAVIDTEHGSASKYAEETAPDGSKLSFDVVELSSFSPDKYIKCIKSAEHAEYDVLVIDSLSHAWFGKDGVLEIVDTEAARSKSGNTFTAWRKGSPEHHKLVEGILRANMHIIVTMRTKTEYSLENINGKLVPKKIGMAPVQRDGVEYEFDIVGDMDLENNMVISKSRYSALNNKIIKKPTKELAQQILAWLNQGDDPKLIQAREYYQTLCEQANELEISFEPLNGQNFDQLAKIGKNLREQINAAINAIDEIKKDSTGTTNDKQQETQSTNGAPSPEIEFINNWNDVDFNPSIAKFYQKLCDEKSRMKIGLGAYWKAKKLVGNPPSAFSEYFHQSKKLALKYLFWCTQQ